MAKRKSLDRADLLAIVSLILTILVVVLPITWWFQCLLLVIVFALVVWLAFVSPWTIGRPWWQKFLFTFVATAALIAVSRSPIKSQYEKQQPPDVIPLFVYPKEPALVLKNNSANTAREIKWGVTLWNLDTPDRRDPLPIPFALFDFIRPHEFSGAEQLFSRSILPLVKAGDRLFGFAEVSCPDCATTREVWVYIEFGKGGWYMPLSKDAPFVNMNHLFKTITDIEKDTEPAIDAIAPPTQRIPIKDIN